MALGREDHKRKELTLGGTRVEYGFLHDPRRRWIGIVSCRAANEDSVVVLEVEKTPARMEPGGVSHPEGIYCTF